jgi:antitoxin component of RelBE/YafQ-DinJ toxin-antitoxin module
MGNKKNLTIACRVEKEVKQEFYERAKQLGKKPSHLLEELVIKFLR